MPCARRAAAGFFPLEEELGLDASSYSPFVHQSIVRLGTWLPFERVPAVLGHFTRVPVSAETARRLTERAGSALAAAETAAVVRLEAANCLPAAPPERVQVSVDGAMVPLVHGAWADVKTLAIGTVTAGAPPHTTALSYCSRLADADTFRRLAWVETQRRGVPAATDVCGVVDGAEWCQHFLDWHGPAAVRSLDFPHAAEYVSAAAQSVFGTGTPAVTAWLDQQLTELKHGAPDQVLAALQALPAVTVAGPDGKYCPRDTAVSYLTKRRAQIAYATFQAAGYPIGSGAVESANKLVVEVRLQGSGMPWARHNVNPLLALRDAACSDRWDAAWATLTRQRHQQQAPARAHRAAARRPAAPPPAAAPPRPERLPRRARRGTICDGRPTERHPWRHGGLRRAGPATAPAKS